MPTTIITLNQGLPMEERPEGLRFIAATMPPEYYDPAWIAQNSGCSLSEAEAVVASCKEELVFRSRDWQVHVKPVPGKDGWPDMWHLNCRRADRQPIHDWRELQTIKNILVGPEHEAVELYPAESRLTDTANNYHLWCAQDSAIRFPFGFSGRAISSSEEAAKVGAVQRPHA